MVMTFAQAVVKRCPIKIENIAPAFLKLFIPETKAKIMVNRKCARLPRAISGT